jgi:hypothetical protein
VVPQQVVVYVELLRTSNGKIDLLALADRAPGARLSASKRSTLKPTPAAVDSSLIGQAPTPCLAHPRRTQQP